MDMITDSKKIVLKNVDAQNVKVKCKCPRCRSEANLCLIDYTILYGVIYCAFCREEGWDDCLMPLIGLEVTHK
jgi:transcription elongation factor Elf1